MCDCIGKRLKICLIETKIIAKKCTLYCETHFAIELNSSILWMTAVFSHKHNCCLGGGATGGSCPQPYYNWVLRFDGFDKPSRGPSLLVSMCDTVLQHTVA